MTEAINHPSHYGGDTPYEAIKVIEAWGLGFCLGNTVKYISRAGKKAEDPSGRLGHSDQEKLRKEKMVEDLKKARWYLDREINALEPKKPMMFRSPMSPAVPVPCGSPAPIEGIAQPVLEGLVDWLRVVAEDKERPVRLVTLDGRDFTGFIVRNADYGLGPHYDIAEVSPKDTIRLGASMKGVIISSGTFTLGELASVTVVGG
jgi:hypothetical protein